LSYEVFLYQIDRFLKIFWHLGIYRIKHVAIYALRLQNIEISKHSQVIGDGLERNF